ncbi:MAG: hypothetical protein JEZ07_09160 [Phycisphaerae bacterium]|nr:hypothetical protein [Phycisphaerae bacterium]
MAQNNNLMGWLWKIVTEFNELVVNRREFVVDCINEYVKPELTGENTDQYLPKISKKVAYLACVYNVMIAYDELKAQRMELMPLQLFPLPDDWINLKGKHKAKAIEVLRKDIEWYTLFSQHEIAGQCQDHQTAAGTSKIERYWRDVSKWLAGQQQQRVQKSGTAAKPKKRGRKKLSNEIDAKDNEILKSWNIAKADGQTRQCFCDHNDITLKQMERIQSRQSQRKRRAKNDIRRTNR